MKKFLTGCLLYTSAIFIAAALKDQKKTRGKTRLTRMLKDVYKRQVLTPAKENVRQNGRRMKEPEEPMFTITATDRHGILYHGRIRRLVPRECLRLQGYYDWQIKMCIRDRYIFRMHMTGQRNMHYM